ncbi:mcfL [Symbiodinium sp. CCMP2456]|nr:mcfL [Symbiodinium sp. CCMP2456]
MSAARLGDFAGQGTVQEELLWAAAGGIVYGATATLLGQPLDTIKTKMQTDRLTGRASGRPGTLQVARQILQTAPGELAHSRPVRKVAGFYRGSLPVLCGSVIFRSVPFTVYSGVYASLEPASFFGTLDPFLGVERRIWLSGAVAGLGRAVVENPFEVLKTQKQVRGLDYQQILKARCLWQGLAATCSRNVVLVTLFFVLSDRLNRSRELVNFLDFRQHPFLRGCIVTSCCWLAAWPLDVIKSQLQSEVLGSRTPADAGGGSFGSQTSDVVRVRVWADSVDCWCGHGSRDDSTAASLPGLFVHAWPTALPCKQVQADTSGTGIGRLRGLCTSGHAPETLSPYCEAHPAARGASLEPGRCDGDDAERAEVSAGRGLGDGSKGASSTGLSVSAVTGKYILATAWQDVKLLRPLPARYTPLRCYEWPPSQVTSSTANSLADAAAKKCAAFRPSKSPGYPERFSPDLVTSAVGRSPHE